MLSVLDEAIAKLKALPPKQREATITKLLEQRRKLGMEKWIPNAGPQTDAYYSQADIMLYGGQAGGGKSHLIVGLAVTQHKRSIIFRRESSQTDGLEADAKQIIAKDASFNGQDLEWTWPDARSLKLAGMKEPDDWMKYAGRERDLMAFDEAGEFLKTQVASLMGWLRGATGQRCRIVLASNPPRSADGEWLILWFAPWLDDKYPNPAAPGELRYAVFVNGDPVWVDGPESIDINGEMQKPVSLTFIPAKLADNPYRDTPEYRARLNSLPEPLRSQLLYGDFKIGMTDSANQMIPTAWVRAAFARWRPDPPEGIPMCAMGVDASGGGDDPMVIACRYDGWYAPLVKVEGKSIPKDRLGPWCAGQVISYRRDSAHVVLDMGGGYGGSTHDHLRENEVRVHAYKGAEGTTRKTKDGQLGFANKRTAAYWQLREALDPDQPGGSRIAMKESNQLLADLTILTFEVSPNGIKAEDKKAVVKKLGRSTDEGDAVVMGWFEGPRHGTDALTWIERREMGAGMNVRYPKVVMGRRPMTAMHSARPGR